MKFITYAGKTLSLSEHARRIGMSRQLLHNRLKRGWSLKRALTEPKKRYRGPNPFTPETP